MVKIDDKAPEFCLPNQDDVEICLRDIKGKWIVLYFYPRDSTPGCTTEACEFTEAAPDFSELDAIVIGVSADTTKKHRSFIEKNDLGITLLSDEDTLMMQAYGVWQMKKNYGKEYMGIVRTTLIINPDGVIKAVFEKVKVKEHVSKVKAELERLQGK
ncbi:MAG: thioredoxin-dependent thiol peroxidase [Epsilonproteobacteria bacterium]|nr:thioredoxin-dependent thiol peroxidase [Campylobacterota bacterium]OIO17803.1 MAG: peroxiredoxin [Helicobacteraceae bacterium CG1_02_36_14]PIP10501.1 MAG: thioredoxin-dependent thiol peroxidase [Sulfurimonas sp. CG23_combo_of_CG06-09_8_20_14_all_36_33]PIS26951.1 MAG: thioredoxin-dependent thiol peroxidase [Sulfurimonas sp. CG08_land_8_20_14_0_20_36_33]PIU35845.1 MAG: thioredoxin-dependent thiol peroxidase [Sulfurimonas sp. CG07_land_8_20_14_0_80_36_56]PIV03422.1 MAG: thioredoxin-dependent t